MNKKMKVVDVDTNFTFNSNRDPALTEYQVDHFKLSEGEMIIAIQDPDEWEGTVKFDQETGWYVLLHGETWRETPEEIQEARLEGYENGKCSGKRSRNLELVELLLADGFSVDDIHKYTQVEKTRITYRKNMLQKEKGDN